MDVTIAMNRTAPLMPLLSVHQTYRTSCVIKQRYPVINVNNPVRVCVELASRLGAIL